MQQAEAATTPAPAKFPPPSAKTDASPTSPTSPTVAEETRIARQTMQRAEAEHEATTAHRDEQARLDNQRRLTQTAISQAEHRWSDADHAELRREATGLAKTSRYGDYLETYGRRALRDDGEKAAAELREIVRLNREMAGPNDKMDADRLEVEVEALISQELGKPAKRPEFWDAPSQEAEESKQPSAQKPYPFEEDGIERHPFALDDPMPGPESGLEWRRQTKEYLAIRDDFLAEKAKLPGGPTQYFKDRQTAFETFEKYAAEISELAVDLDDLDEGDPKRAELEAAIQAAAGNLREAAGKLIPFALPKVLAGDRDLIGATFVPERPSGWRMAGDALALGAGANIVTGVLGKAFRIAATAYGIGTEAYDAIMERRQNLDIALSQNLQNAGIDLTDPQAIANFAKGNVDATRKAQFDATVNAVVSTVAMGLVEKVGGKLGQKIASDLKLGPIIGDLIGLAIDASANNAKTIDRREKEKRN